MSGPVPAVTSATDTSPPPPPSAGPSGAEWVLRARWDRLRARFPQETSAGVLQGAWAVSGFLLGVAFAHVFAWSAVSLVVAGLVGAGLSWLGRGVATVMVAGAATLGGISVAFFIVLQAFPKASWSMDWLFPLSVLLFAGVVLAARRSGISEWQTSRLAAAVLDLVAGGGSLALAWVCAHRIATSTGSSILLTSEDNGAWVNAVGLLHNAHGVTAETLATISTFGPVVETYLAFVREATGGLLPTRVMATQSADAVLYAHVLLIVLVPPTAALLARRTLRFGRTGLTLLSWLAAAVLLVSFAVVLPIYGFLTATLALLLLVSAVCLVPGTPLDPRSAPTVVRWLAALLVIYAAGSAWVPLMPLGALALTGWYAALAWPAISKGPWATVRMVGVLAVPTALLGLALVEQYRDVTGPIGGGDALLTAGGGTPVATDVMTSAAIGLVALGWVAHRSGSARTTRRHPAMVGAVGWVLGYTALVFLIDAWSTRAAPHYGSIKLQYVVVGALLVLGIADLLASTAVGERRLDVSAVLVVAAIFAGTVGEGPVYVAAESHWPKPIALPPWVNTVDHVVGVKARVLCLGVTPKPDESPPNLDAYNCDRWASSLQGKDDPTALSWRFVQLGRQPVSNAVALLDKAKDLPWKIVVVGSPAGLHDPKAWWAPILAKPGRLTFVSVGP